MQQPVGQSAGPGQLKSVPATVMARCGTTHLVLNATHSLPPGRSRRCDSCSARSRSSRCRLCMQVTCRDTAQGKEVRCSSNVSVVHARDLQENKRKGGCNRRPPSAGCERRRLSGKIPQKEAPGAGEATAVLKSCWLG